MTGELQQEGAPGPAPDSKLARIERQLHKPGVIIAGWVHRIIDPPQHGIFERYNFLISPEEPIYRANQLTRFTYALVDLRRISQRGAHDYGTFFTIPRVEYSENIGTITTEPKAVFEIPEKGIRRETGSNTSKVSTIRRKIYLHVYPDQQIANLAVILARHALKGGSLPEKDEIISDLPFHDMSPKLLEKSQKGIDFIGELRQKYPDLFAETN